MAHVDKSICYLGSLSPKARDEYYFLADVGLFRHNCEATLIRLTDVLSVTMWEATCIPGSHE